ncbi:glutamate--tRNA ligase [bacterium]|nr:glutamate--tRNA ligase [bacterium]
MTRPVRTRFAPSPTGYMHIGGMRTALFCWLWARHTNGRFILRIDDTDQERNVESALAPIFRAFRWLGLDWDEGPEQGGPYTPYYQSQRGHLYQAAVEKLLAAGKAYRDFETPEQIAADRQQAEANKVPYLSSRRSLSLTPDQIAVHQQSGQPSVVRLLVPRDRKVAIDDAVRGHVEWDCGLMPDPVLQRSNGSFLYNFATVVDDAQLQITHVIRAEEHLTNTAVQVLLYEALEQSPPTFAHIPFITAPGSTKKLSKRDLEKLRKNPGLQKLFDRADVVFPQLSLGDSTTLSPVMVEYYEQMGYLPAGVLNGLARLGWSLDDKTEIFSRDDLIREFSLERINKSSAAFDADKLLSFQAHWMSQLSLDEKIDGCWPFLKRAKLVQDWFPAGEIPESCPVDRRGWLGELLTAFGDRLKVFSDILDTQDFFVADTALVYEEKAYQKKIVEAPEAKEILQALTIELAACQPFDAPTLEQRVHAFVETRGLKFNQVIQPLRIALTGKTAGMGLFETLVLLGQDRCLSRLRHLISRLPV